MEGIYRFHESTPWVPFLLQFKSWKSLTDVLTLSNSKVKIPQLGFGVYQSPAKVCVESCLTALKAGYRHIDSAQYVNSLIVWNLLTKIGTMKTRKRSEKQCAGRD